VGSALVQVRVGRDGRAHELVVVQSAGCPRLDAAALEAVSGYRFAPARSRSGATVDSTERVAVRFTATS
jgi:TonB family protein